MSKVGENIYRRKDGRWEGRFISGRKPDGRAKYTYAYGRTRRETKEKLEKRKLMIAVQPTGSCRMTVKELFSWYLAKIEVKPSTRARYVFVIENHILPQLGSVFIAYLTAIQLSDFLTQKQKHGRLHGGGLSAKSVRDIGVLIKSSAPGGSCGVSLSLRRIERQAAESKAAKDRAVFYVRTRPDRKSPIAVGQS